MALHPPHRSPAGHVTTTVLINNIHCSSCLSYIQEILRNGTGADRQLEVWNQSNDLKDVVDYIVEETHRGLEEG